MKTRLLFLATAVLALPACNRNTAQSDEQRQADEKRISELRDLESRAAQRDADAKAAQLEADRQRLANDQAALDEEKRKLAEEKSALRDEAAEARYRADEKRLAEREAALRKDRERAADDAREARAADEARQAKQEAAEQKIDLFYNALDPLGDWMEVAPYGYVWQPREARSGDWRPYTDGNWVYTDYGWTWKANEPFGWATYHYGRWARLRDRGWVWVPGSEWAPAWVSWRKSPEYVGWAPLPPEAHSGAGFNSGVDSYYDIGPASYTFVPAGRIGEPTYRGIVVEPARNVTIVNQTVNVTRINYTTVENKTVVFNRGPDLDQINAGSARPIERLRLEREPQRAGGGAGNNIAGGVLHLVAPNIASAPRAAAAPAKVKEKVAAPVVEHGWGTSDTREVQAVRTQLRQEAAQAEQPAPHALPAKIAKPFVPAATPVVQHEPPRPKAVEPAVEHTTPHPKTATPRAEPPVRPAESSNNPPPLATPRPMKAPVSKPAELPAATPRAELPLKPRAESPDSPAPLGTPAGKPRKATPPDGLPGIPPANPRKGPPMPDSAPEPRKAQTLATPPAFGGPRPSGTDKKPGKPGATPQQQ